MESSPWSDTSFQSGRSMCGFDKKLKVQRTEEKKTLSEAEKKKLTKIWKKRKKKTDPLEFKKIYEEYRSAKAEKGKLEGQIRKLGKELEQKQSAGRDVRQRCHGRAAVWGGVVQFY